jgi:hypothetical protein
MNSFAQCLRLSAVFPVLLFAGLKMPITSFSGAQSPKAAACSAPEYHQFDFWAGDWDSFDFGSATKNARIRVDRILDGCVLREDYQGADGHKGQSFSIYDASRKVWHQTWVTNRGELLIIEGKFESGEMVLSGSDLTPNGQHRQVRGTWKPADGGVRETAVVSTDAGKTWQPWFDLMFRPHKP